MPAKPAYEIRRGLIKVRVRRKRTQSGPRYSVIATRLFRDGDVWKESARFDPGSIPLVRLLLDKAYVWILQQTSQDNT